MYAQKFTSNRLRLIKLGKEKLKTKYCIMSLKTLQLDKRDADFFCLFVSFGFFQYSIKVYIAYIPSSLRCQDSTFWWEVIFLQQKPTVTHQKCLCFKLRNRAHLGLTSSQFQLLFLKKKCYKLFFQLFV